MSEAQIQFFARLNDFLSREKRGETIVYPIYGPVSVKHAVEALGVPHTDIELIVVNDRSVGFSYKVRPGDRIGIYPDRIGLDIAPIQQLRPPVSRPLCFVVDNHLGRLASYLRILGFDTLYRNDYRDEELAQVAYQEKRILLTRDRRLLMRRLIEYGHCLQTRDPRSQLDDVLYRYRSVVEIKPWRRCIRCNGQLKRVPKEEILNRLEPKTKKYYHVFHICPDCQQIYWKGSHYEPLRQFVDQFRTDR